jgi:lysyl-tRNA synthetase-like protein GenX
MWREPKNKTRQFPAFTHQTPACLQRDGVADWRPGISLTHLKLRAELLKRIRVFCEQRNLLEVETPALSSAASTDPHSISFAARSRGLSPLGNRFLYLHTSPEFAMKRLLAAGSGSIYQICKVFRDGERGRLHNPEFTLLEWYRQGWDHHQLMDEVELLVRECLKDRVCDRPAIRMTYREAFLRYAGIDPHQASTEALRACAHSFGIGISKLSLADARDTWLNLLLTHVVETHLEPGRLVFIYDYPMSQAALARIVPGSPPVAARFELYVDGVELANGFHELKDAREQASRFEKDLAMRDALGLARVPRDDRLLLALEAGLPDCAGVALGFDRLVMLATGARSLSEVMPFPIEHA